MITIAITWAITATALGIWAAVGLWVLEKEHSQALSDRWFYKCAANQWRLRAKDSEDRLRKIERQRHEAAKKGRAAQIQQYRSKVAQTTSQINRELGR